MMSTDLFLLKARVQKLEKALEFYADVTNWFPGDSFKQSCRITEADLTYFAGTQTSDLIGGKTAREALQDPPVLSSSTESKT